MSYWDWLPREISKFITDKKEQSEQKDFISMIRIIHLRFLVMEELTKILGEARSWTYDDRYETEKKQTGFEYRLHHNPNLSSWRQWRYEIMTLSLEERFPSNVPTNPITADSVYRKNLYLHDGIDYL